MDQASEGTYRPTFTDTELRCRGVKWLASDHKGNMWQGQESKPLWDLVQDFNHKAVINKSFIDLNKHVAFPMNIFSSVQWDSFSHVHMPLWSCRLEIFLLSNIYWNERLWLLHFKVRFNTGTKLLSQWLSDQMKYRGGNPGPFDADGVKASPYIYALSFSELRGHTKGSFPNKGGSPSYSRPSSLCTTGAPCPTPGYWCVTLMCPLFQRFPANLPTLPQCQGSVHLTVSHSTSFPHTKFLYFPVPTSKTLSFAFPHASSHRPLAGLLELLCLGSACAPLEMSRLQKREGTFLEHTCYFCWVFFPAFFAFFFFCIVPGPSLIFQPISSTSDSPNDLKHDVSQSTNYLDILG